MGLSARILVVDDDAEIVQLLRTALEEDGHSVIIGFDGQMALTLARQYRPQLILMDVNMPMTNGLMALEFMRKLPELQSVPVVFLTGASSQAIYPTVAAHHRVAYLKKPVDLEDLRSIVRQILEPAA